MKEKKSTTKSKKAPATKSKKQTISKKQRKEIEQNVLAFLDNNPKRSFNYKQISSALDLRMPEERAVVFDALDILEMSGLIEQTENGKFRSLIPDTIPDETESKVGKTFVGILEIKEHYSFLNVERKYLEHDILIPMRGLNGARNNQKCVAKITEWKDFNRNPIGEIVAVLGDVGDNNAEMHAILAEFGLPYTYPKEVEEAAEQISDIIPDAEIAAREDFRDATTFTIDPKDAKDFDDALSFRDLDNGTYEIGVHIADVSYYVEEGSMIDNEAYNRATSVYLVDRTIPMLPEKLCNNLCSLRPDEDKLAYSVIFVMNDEAEVKESRIVRTVIRSNRRFAYEDAQTVIEQQDMSDDVNIAINKLNVLAQKLRESRFDNGSIAFERVETAFEIDEKGKPVNVYFKESKDANKLIEEFMLLANRTVATRIGKPGHGAKPKTFVYRVHDVPNPDKLEAFAKFIARFGYRFKAVGKNTEVSYAINRLLDDVQGKREQNLIETLAVRSMAKAIYTTTNVGHYGLAFDFYTHFTSPIRRYPDLMVHRLLTRYLFEKGRSVSQEDFEEKCQHSSDMEQLAANAERASIKYKQVEYMQEHIGEVYDGVISGVTEWGIFVELNENKCEGMVSLRSIKGDFFVFDEKNYCVIGTDTKKRYQLGDSITVRISKADLIKKQLDFEII
ncbi:MAG: ribonuclease R [bacterium]|nr:ribonuclease R [Candidatus Minthenecus merdequi]